MLIILIGKSAVGKDSVLKEIMKHGYSSIVSTTTRPIREKETPDVSYHFTDRETFQNLINKGEMVEYVQFQDNFYGIQSSDVDTNRNQVVVLELEGTKCLVEKFGRENVYVVSLEMDEHTREQWARKRGSFDETSWRERCEQDNKMFTEENIKPLADLRVDVFDFAKTGKSPADVATKILKSLEAV